MRRFFPFAVVLVLLATGCTRSGAAFGLGLLVGAAAMSHHEHHHAHETEVIYVVEQPPVPNASPAPPPAPEPAPAIVPFDPQAARNALHAIEVESCKERGLPRGYGHAKVTFAADGSVAK